MKVTFLLAVAGFRSAAIAGAQSTTLRFDLSGGKAMAGYTKVSMATRYTNDLGYGFEDAAQANGKPPLATARVNRIRQ